MGEQRKNEWKELGDLVENLNPDHIFEATNAYSHFVKNYNIKQLRHNPRIYSDAHNYAIDELRKLYADILHQDKRGTER